MSSGAPRGLLAVVALLAVVGTAAVGTAVADSTAASYAQQEPAVGDNTTTVIKVSLQGDSDARWTITEHFDVSSPEDREVFEDLANRFERGETAQLGLPTFRLARERVATTVDREMQIHEVRREPSV
jgi:hypothetical protein